MISELWMIDLVFILFETQIMECDMMSCITKELHLSQLYVTQSHDTKKIIEGFGINNII